MLAQKDKSKVFSGLKALKANAKDTEREQLFRNMGQLFAHVSHYCSDEQISQYDDVLCQLVDLVEQEAREHVAKLLAPLDRAPSSVVLRLAHDEINVARPLLEFSSILSDDDLIEIVKGKTEEHRVAIAGRENIAANVGNAIAENGGDESIAKLIENESADIGSRALEKALHLAKDNDRLAQRLRNRQNIDWQKLRNEISIAGAQVLAKLSLCEKSGDNNVDRISDVVYNRMRSRAGFCADEWKIAWNQVKALNDRKQLNSRTLARFVRFGYGHHVAAALTLMMNVSTKTFVKWLASQDYVGVSVACKVFGLSDDLFEGIIALLPWRDVPSKSDIEEVKKRFEKLNPKEAQAILNVWREKSKVK